MPYSEENDNILKDLLTPYSFSNIYYKHFDFDTQLCISSIE